MNPGINKYISFSKLSNDETTSIPFSYLIELILIFFVI